MKILIDSLVWLLFWKIIIKTFTWLLSNPFLSLQKSPLSSKVNFWHLLHLAGRMKALGRTVVPGKTSNSPLLTAGTDASIYRAPASHRFQMAIWSCTRNIIMPWRFSPLSSSAHKWKQVLIHQRILSVALIASFCYSWQMARFLWVEEKTFPSRHQIFVLPWHTSHRIQEQENGDSMNSPSDRKINNGGKYTGHEIN